MRQEGRKIKAETEGEKERKAGRGDGLTERKKDMEREKKKVKRGGGGEKCDGSPFPIDPKSLVPLDFRFLPPVSETQGKTFPGMS